MTMQSQSPSQTDEAAEAELVDDDLSSSVASLGKVVERIAALQEVANREQLQRHQENRSTTHSIFEELRYLRDKVVEVAPLFRIVTDLEIRTRDLEKAAAFRPNDHEGRIASLEQKVTASSAATTATRDYKQRAIDVFLTSLMAIAAILGLDYFKHLH